VIDVAVRQQEQDDFMPAAREPIGGILRRIDQDAVLGQEKTIGVKDAAGKRFNAHDKNCSSSERLAPPSANTLESFVAWQAGRCNRQIPPAQARLRAGARTVVALSTFSGSFMARVLFTCCCVLFTYR
jgi:hypothetical protein